MDDNKNAKTEWLGLWNNREGVYSGQIIKKADIPPYSRLIVRFNKFYEKDSKKPRFVYCFANGDAAKAITVKVDRSEYKDIAAAIEENEKFQGMRCFTDDQLQRLINLIAYEIGGDHEYGEHIISDYVSGYGSDTEVY